VFSVRAFTGTVHWHLPIDLLPAAQQQIKVQGQAFLQAVHVPGKTLPLSVGGSLAMDPAADPFAIPGAARQAQAASTQRNPPFRGSKKHVGFLTFHRRLKQHHSTLHTSYQTLDFLYW